MRVIYMMVDPRFAVGVKVGRDSNWPHRLKIAQCYGPAGLAADTIWIVPAAVQLHVAEAAAHRALTRHLFGVQGGVEWFRHEAGDAFERIDGQLRLLGCTPMRPAPASKLEPYDDYRDPVKVVNYAATAGMATWLYEENDTGRLKVQYNPYWASNIEHIRTYSRNGFRAIAAFVPSGMSTTGPFEDACRGSAALAARIHVNLGLSENRLALGWLRAGATRDDVEQLAHSEGFVTLDLGGPRPSWCRRLRNY